MKKKLALLLALVIAFGSVFFTACTKNNDDDKKKSEKKPKLEDVIEGEWELCMGIIDFYGDTPEEDEGRYEFLKYGDFEGIEITRLYTFDDGEVKVTIDEDENSEFLSEFKNAYVNYYEEKTGNEATQEFLDGLDKQASAFMETGGTVNYMVKKNTIYFADEKDGLEDSETYMKCTVLSEKKIKVTKWVTKGYSKKLAPVVMTKKTGSKSGSNGTKKGSDTDDDKDDDNNKKSNNTKKKDNSATKLENIIGGNWQFGFDLQKIFEASEDEDLEEVLEFCDFSGIEMTFNIRFNNGEYTITTDSEKMVEKMKVALRKGIIDYYVSEVGQEPTGEDLAELDEIIEESVADMVDSLSEDEDSGYYRVDGNKIYFADTKSGLKDADEYMLCTVIDKKTIKVTDWTGDDNSAFDTLVPFNMAKK